MNGTKRARLVDDDYQRETLEKLDGIQKDIDALNVSAAQDIIKVEEVYTKKRKIHFEQRSELLKSIPKFWVSVFQNHPDMSQVVKDEEIYCLSHLINVVVDENEKIASGYRIHFYFEANPFFDNEIITKEFIMKPMTRTVSTNTPILWKEGKELSKPTLKTKGRKRRYERISFFHWIQDHSDPDNDDIAEMIKEDLWVNPLQFYCIFEDEEHFYNQNSSELRENGAVDDGDEDDVEIIDEEEVEEEEEDEELDEEEVEDEELLEEDGNEEEVTVIDDECKDA